MNPIMKPPPVRRRLRIENISTSIEPVLTLDGSPELIITAPIMIIIPKITPRIAMRITSAPSPPRNGTSIMAPPSMPARIEPINDPMSMKIPPIKDSMKAAVGRSAGMEVFSVTALKVFLIYLHTNITIIKRSYICITIRQILGSASLV